MASYTTRYQLTKPTVGGDADVWGTGLNQSIDDMDALLGAITTTGSGAAYVLTTGLSLAAYVTGQGFWIKASFTCNAAATINVDGIGAKNITKNGTAATISGDIVSGNCYFVVYDGTQFQAVGPVAFASQPLDATLTALAALSWSSGSPLLQFTAADTVSLTLTPSVSSVTASQGAAATTATASFTNTTDNASLRVGSFEGKRATPGGSDLAYNSFFLANSAGTKTEVARESWKWGVNTAGGEYGIYIWSVAVAGAITNQLLLQSGLFAPNTNDGVALGQGTQAFSDLFLASGGAVNFNNGDVTITHSSDLLSVAGGDLQANLPLSTETTGTLTTASANKHILATGGITLPNSVFAARNITTIDGNGTSRTITRGSGVTMYVNGTDSATATLNSNGLMAVYWRTASICALKGDVA